MIRAVIDQAAFENLVAGKTVKLANTGYAISGEIYGVELILSDIGFGQMITAIRQAAMLPPQAPVSGPVLTVEKCSEKEYTIYDGPLYLGSHYVGDGIVLNSSSGSTVEVEVVEALAAKMRELDAQPCKK